MGLLVTGDVECGGSAFVYAVDNVVSSAQLFVRAQSRHQIAIAGDVIQPVERRRSSLSAAELDVVIGACVAIGTVGSK